MLHEHKAIQFAAKQVLDELYDEITPKSSERSVATFAANRLSDIGYPDTWYHACPALVLAGSNSCLSVSGRDYIPDDVIFGSHNLITVDLSPCTGPIWGDCARSFAIENGLVTKTPEDSEFIKGINTEYALHEAMQQFVTPSTSFHDLHEFINELTASFEFENLDFLGNVGHSIVASLEDRDFIEPGNHKELANARLFTLEPHIKHKNGAWGFKHENIYYFSDSGKLTEL